MPDISLVDLGEAEKTGRCSCGGWVRTSVVGPLPGRCRGTLTITCTNCGAPPITRWLKPEGILAAVTIGSVAS